VQTLIESGQLDEAARRLAADSRLADEDRATLRLHLVRARIAAGDLDGAGTMLARDSSVEALALKGWITLYRGRLKPAWQLFLEAGPYAGDHREATERAAMLALLQQLAAGAGEGSDSQVVKRREFVRAVGANALGLALPLSALYRPLPPSAAQLLVPMDDAQGDHLKAYGVTYRVVQAGIKAEWLLNYRGG